MRRVAAAILAALFGIACGSGGPTVVPSTVHFINTPDGVRSYRLYDPGTWRALVVALHPLNGTAADFEAYTHFDEQGRRNGFRVVYPQGLKEAWNAGYCCPAFRPYAVDDVGFIRAILAEVDPVGKPVFVLGFSNGAMAAYRLACAGLPNLKALAVAGSDAERCSPAPPLPAILQFQGTSDTFTGNRLWALAGDQWQRQPGTGTGYWASLGAEVKLVAVQGGSHEWYQHNPDASLVAAAFFRGHLASP